MECWRLRTLSVLICPNLSSDTPEAKTVATTQHITIVPLVPDADNQISSEESQPFVHQLAGLLKLLSEGIPGFQLTILKARYATVTQTHSPRQKVLAHFLGMFALPIAEYGTLQFFQILFPATSL